MQLDMNMVLAIIGVVLAGLTLYNTVVTHRSQTNKQLLQESEKRCMDDTARVRQELVGRITTNAAQIADLNAKLSQLRLDFTRHTGTVLTRKELDGVMESAMEPVTLHMQRVESFIEEILRAGILTTATRHHERGTQR